VKENPKDKGENSQKNQKNKKLVTIRSPRKKTTIRADNARTRR
jgi:hypothetical protein